MCVNARSDGSHSNRCGVPLGGLVDIEEEIARLRKNIEKAQKEAVRLQARLGDKNFLANAPAEIVEEGRSQLEEIKSRAQTMQDSLNRLQN